MEENYTNKAIVRQGFCAHVKRGKKTIIAESGEEIMLSERELKRHQHQIEVKGGSRAKAN